MRHFVFALLFAAAGSGAWAQTAPTPDDLTKRLDRLELRMGQLASEPRTVVQNSVNYTDSLPFFLCGVFCALWAQNTHRNAWLWFFFGFFLSVIALLFLLSKNSENRNRRGEQMTVA